MKLYLLTKTRFAIVTSLLFSLLSAQDKPAAEEADVIIYGGTSAGIAAAVQVSRMGKKAIVLAPDWSLGGLSSSGLGMTDSGRKDTIGGISREFYERVHDHYSKPDAWHLQDPDELKSKSGKEYFNPKSDTMWVFEPHVAEQIFEAFVVEFKIKVVRDQKLDRESGVEMKDGHITSIRMVTGESYRGHQFIDATYEGDLLAAAGVSYHVGREANSVYGETLNGVQKKQMKGHLFTKAVDPYIVPGDASSGLVPRVHGDPPGEDGSGDKRIQAYNYRMCMSNDPDNQVPFPKPKDYDEAQYELLFRNFEAGDLRMPWSPGMLPNHKTDTNNYGAFSTDNIGMNYEYPEASYAEREKILAEHKSYQQGLMWTLANHPRIPEVIRKGMEPWGLAADEFTDNGYWPREIYVREARRMVSDYVVTELDCRRVRVAEDSVGLGSYNMDSHNTQRYVTPEGTVQDEGDVQVSPGGPYVVSYRSIIPKKSECENLTVPVCVSSSHIAFGSIRMEPVFMILGQSAATAAVFSIDDGIALQDLPYEKLRKKLLEDGLVLDLPADAKPRELISAATMEGIVVDDNDADYEGAWNVSTSAPRFIESGYRHDAHTELGNDDSKTATFSPELPESGKYEVRISYPANSNRASNTPVTIQHAEGSKSLTVNQKSNEGDKNGFVSLGTFLFNAGEGSVMVSNKGTDGYVVIDAVQFLKKP